eukprot:8594691-Pyramimonas_sp.AAC.1
MSGPRFFLAVESPSAPGQPQPSARALVVVHGAAAAVHCTLTAKPIVVPRYVRDTASQHIAQSITHGSGSRQ